MTSRIRLSLVILSSIMGVQLSFAQSKKNSTTQKNITTTDNTSNVVEEIKAKSNAISSEMGNFEQDVTFYSISEALAAPSSVTKLILNNQGLNSIPSEISKFSNLKELNLSDNNIQELGSSLSSLSNLEVLNLSGNNFSSIPSELCGLKNLRSLNLSNNKISGGSVSCMTNLERLFLNNNQLTSLPSGLTELSSLKSIYLQSNSLTTLSDKLATMLNLQVLLVHLNKIAEEPLAFKNNGIIKYVFNPQAINNAYLYKYMTQASTGNTYSGINNSSQGPSNNSVDLTLTTNNSNIIDYTYNIRTQDIGNGFRLIKIGDHPYKRYSKFRLAINAYGYILLWSEIHWLISKKHRDNVRLSYIYYQQKEVERLSQKKFKFKRLKKANRINKSTVRKYRRYLRSHGLRAN